MTLHLKIALQNNLFNAVKSISNHLMSTWRRRVIKIKSQVYLLLRNVLVHRLRTLGYGNASSSRGWRQIFHGGRKGWCLRWTRGRLVELGHGGKFWHRGNRIAIHLVNVRSDFVKPVKNPTENGTELWIWCLKFTDGLHARVWAPPETRHAARQTNNETSNVSRFVQECECSLILLMSALFIIPPVWFNNVFHRTIKH